ncbi:hypothetical protein [Streptomyces sp. TRM68416]|uniref:tetratricopeptide repeat protein n=1 Tax=Streptomyces sp. TRM68416 TaxID=2758412 RepID=UPI002948B7E3|nr:hypothetical protein [Streptomyces sp. TRM68416]
MRSPRTPNQALRLLLAEAGWTGAHLARQVNSLGAAQGTPRHYDRTTVAHWLAGSRPRPPVPDLVAEALSRRLGRPVRAEDTGLLGPGRRDRGVETPPGEGSAVEHLDRILRDTDRRSVALAGAYSLAALAVSHGPLSGTRPHTSAADPPTRVGTAHVTSAGELLALFSRSDASFGAGPVREPLRQYLSTTLLPWLRCDMKPAVRRELFSVAAQLTYLCAFTHFDMNRHAAAQRLYLTSVELAREAGDPVGHALGLRGLSVQAHALGHFAEARHLAEAAVRIGARHVPPHQQAFLLGQLAVTEAGVGDARSTRLLAAAERCLERWSSGVSPVGVFHHGSLALQHAAVARSMKDNRAAARALDLSLRCRPADERRSRALGLAELAEVQLAAGHLDQACLTWHEFLDAHPHIHSARADDRLRALTCGLRPNAAHPAAAALLARTRAMRLGARRDSGRARRPGHVPRETRAGRGSPPPGTAPAE